MPCSGGSIRPVAALALIFVTACSAAAVVRKLTPPADDARAREYLDFFTHQQTDAAMARLVPSLQTPEARTELAKMSEIFKGLKFDSIAVINVNVSATGTLTAGAGTQGARRTALEYELRSEGKWYYARVATVDSAGDWRVEGVNCQTLPQSLESIDWFPLANRPPLVYAWLLATIAAFLISLGSAIFIATRRDMPKRWRWVFMATLGGGSFVMNWSTGAWTIKPLMLKLLCAGFIKYGLYAPYQISFALPLGAAMALSKYRTWKKTQSAVPLDAPVASAPSAPEDLASKPPLDPLAQ